MGRIVAVDRAISAKIKARRVEVGMTLQELADHLGCHMAQVHRIENGVNRAYADQLWWIARALDCSVDDLMPDERARRPDPRIARLVKMHVACRAVSDPRLRRALLKLAVALAEDQEAA